MGPALRTQPKRKATERVSYVPIYDSSDEQSEESDAGSDDSEAPANKKRKPNTQVALDKPLPKRKIFPFNSLPAELKNKIYFLTLTDPNGVFFISGLKSFRRIVVRETHGAISDGNTRRIRQRYHGYHNPPAPDPTKDQRIAPLRPNITILNRQMYEETQPILYGANTFTVEDTTALHGFLAGIGPKNCATLNEIVIKGWGYSRAHKTMNHPGLTLLTNAPNLKRLSIDTEIYWGGGARKAAKQLYRDGFRWLEALYAAKGTAGFDIIELHKDNFEEQRYGRFGGTPPKQHSHEESMKLFKEELKKYVCPRGR